MRIKTRLLIVLFITFVSACIEHNGLRSQNELTDMDGLNIDSIAFLHEIVVTTKPPMFTDEEEKVTMYIEGTPLSESGSARDLLQKSSKIKADDRYGTFVGIKEAMIYVDGREVPDSQILDMLSSNEISKIDIITTPSIRYDSRARAVIEITTIRGKNTGTDLKVNTRMSKGDYWSKLVGTTLNANFSKFTLFSSYIFSPNTRKNQETYLRDVDWSFMPDVYSVKSDIREKIDTRQDHKLRLGGNYYFSDDHKLGLEFSYHSNKGDRRKTTFNHFYLEDGSERPGSDTKKPYNNDFDRSYLTGTVYHQYKNKSGLSLLSSLDISNIKNKKKNIIDEENLGNYPNNGDESDILTLKSDAVIPLPNEFRLEAGIKYTDRHSTSYNDKFIDDEQTQLKRIPKYDFKRKVGAMYGLLSKQFNKLRVGTGLRVEYYDSYIMAEDKVTHDVINWDFSPTLELSYSPIKKLKIDFLYVMNTYRPSFEELNPIRDGMDIGLFMAGNPDLKREKRHNWNVKATYKRTSFGVNYARQYDAVVWFMDKVNGEEDRISRKNIKRSDLLSFDMLTNHFNSYMDGFLASGLIFTDNKDKALQGMNMKDPIWYIFAGGVFNLPYDLELNMSHRYFTKGLVNVLYFRPVYRADIGVSRSFLQDKLLASIMWNDIFSTDKMKTYTNINGRDIRHTYNYDQSILSISLSYKFILKK